MTPGPQIAPDASPGARPSRVLIVVLLAAIAAGVVLRCDGLGRKVPWYDEVGTMLRISGHTEAEVATFAAERPRAPRELLERFQRPSRDARASAAASAVVRAVVEDEPPHSPGYFVAASLWTRAAGGDPAAVRALSAAASIASLPLLGLLAWRLFGNRWVALATVALAALSPVQIRYAQEARSYALWSLTLLATSLAMLAASCRGRGGASSGTHARRDGAASAAWLAVTLCFAAALYVHPLSLLALPALLLLAHDASATPRAARAQVVGGALALGAAIGLWVPWTMVVIAHG
ncbi:hypothetical protein K2Z84_33715, partial [Candidatus Binatia bacterium]|nr:hypothetical protein [Candidatus Binatia bacterium]